MTFPHVPAQIAGVCPSRLSEPADFEPAGQHPAFLVGQDDAGHWLAVEANGLGGGIFSSREAALGYVGFETGHDPQACRLAREPIGFGFKIPAPPRG